MARPLALSRRRRRAIAAARACVGTPFRPQGRQPGIALDCVGVALVAARAAGVPPPDVPAYRIGGGDEMALTGHLAGMGCRRVRRVRPGDLLVVVTAPGRQHLLVVTDTGVVHAHAGLGRVVEGPVDPDWRLASAWALPGGR